MASSLTRFLDHTQRRTTLGRTPLDEWSARRRDLYLTTHNTHNRQTSTPPVGFEPTLSAGERPQAYTVDNAATGTGRITGIGLQKSHVTLLSLDNVKVPVLAYFFRATINSHQCCIHFDTIFFITCSAMRAPVHLFQQDSPRLRLQAVLHVVDSVFLVIE